MKINLKSNDKRDFYVYLTDLWIAVFEIIANKKTIANSKVNIFLILKKFNFFYIVLSLKSSNFKKDSVLRRIFVNKRIITSRKKSIESKRQNNANIQLIALTLLFICYKWHPLGLKTVCNPCTESNNHEFAQPNEVDLIF